ncbi:hypothetical protein K458DRAFT_479847 [Lentithecium fluviatile CBS 122367]|uniref:Zn(2)-C6 fungal-type domain-containing protein n=1 Tax=Lentithecium fluviatile CBS 122367 TaxID=1168545 RepID=A0A6G1IRC8_9PLEO|nr:hypothetical protein K458DRAFT_479847 [Lentithecium fluviatile CBS 122367]
MMKPTTVADKANRQCWECLKRRLVCDFTLPHCKKCLKNGRQCSGYDEKKPLQWVEPGQVLSRRRRKAPSKEQGSDMRVPRPRKCSDKESSSDDSTEDTTSAKTSKDVMKEFSERFTPWKDDDIDEVMALADRITIKMVVSEKRHEEAQKMLRKVEGPEKALRALERMLKWVEQEDIPTYNLRSDASEVVQAVHYLNTRMYPQGLVSTKLAPNPHIIMFPMAALHVLPPSVHHIVVVLSLNHFVNSLPAAAGKRIVVGNWDKIYQHRGAALRELTHSISKPKTRCGDATITSVVMFLAAELGSHAQSDWRTHALGLIKLFEMRGGMMNVYRHSLHMRPSIVIFAFILVFANCTGPAANQVFTTPSLSTFLADISELYEELFPHVLCPPTLYQEFVRINYLRYEASQALINYSDMTDLTLQAHEILARIDAFEPRDWAQPGDNYDTWLTIGSTYKHTVAVYALTSLTSLTVLPSPSFSPTMRTSLSSHGALLLHHLKIAFESPVLRRFLALCISVAGVEAIYRGEGDRRWIEEALTELSSFTGGIAPLKAHAALRRYWQREEFGWEECFMKPYGFML